MICGDMNARSGSQQDFISNDEIDHVPLYDDYNIDISSLPRQSKDSIIDARGRSIIDLCTGNQLRILNGRCFGDMFGQFTCFTLNGCSVVDYSIVSESILNQILYFHVSDYLATLSDCHCKLSWGMLANFTYSDNVCSLNPLPVKYCWDNSSSAKFQQTLQSEVFSNKIKNYMNIPITDTQSAACQIKDILL